MALPVVYPDWRLYPPDDATEVLRAMERNFKAKVINKTLTLPEDYTPFANQAIVVRAEADGPVPASQLTEGHVLFGGKGVRNYQPGRIPITSSLTLTENDHGGADIEMGNVSAASLTLLTGTDPAVGVTDGFVCSVLRLASAADVSIVMGSGMTNRNPDGHTKIVAGGMIVIRVIGLDVYTFGYGSS